MKNKKKKNDPKKPRTPTAASRAKKRPDRRSPKISSGKTRGSGAAGGRTAAEHPAIDKQTVFHEIISAIGDGISIQSRDFQILYQNAAHKEMVGDHTGEYCYRAHQKRESVCDGCPLELSLRDGKVHAAERSSETSGGTRYVEITTSPLTDSSGKIIAGIEVVRDITDRKKAQEETRKTNTLLQTLLQSIPDVIYCKNRDGRYQFVNRFYEELFHMRSVQILGKTLADILPPGLAEKAAASDRMIWDSGKTVQEEQVFKSGGRMLFFDTIKTPMVGEQGNIIGLLGVSRDITGRKQMEEALRESEQRYHDLFENANDPIFILDAEQRYVDVNRKAVEVFGYSKEEFQRMNVLDLVPPDQKARSEEAFKKLRNKGEYERFEGRARTKDGRWINIEVSSSAILKKGKQIGSRDIVRDITERKRVEDALKHSRDLLAKAEEIAKLGSWEWDIATNTLEWSDEVYRLYGLPKGKGAPSYDVVLNTLHPDFREKFTMDIESALMRGQPLDGEYCLVRPDGTLRFTRSKGEVVRDNAGKPVRMVGIVQDITDQKQAELMVRNVLETVDEGFIIIDRDYRILSANRAYAQQAGRSVDEIIGKKCHKISHGFTKPCHDFGETCAVRQVFETGEPHTALHTHQNEKNEPIYVETKAFPMRDAAGRVAAAIEIVNNISEQKKLEDQLRHAQKMEAVGLLAGGIAHDFNNILTAIIGYGNLLEMRYPEDDPHRQYVDQILAAAARAANLTQSLLAFSRKQVINPRPLDLNEIIGRVEKLLQRVIGEDVDLRTELQPGALMVMADSGQMEQVLMNLATNARDAMPAGGVLTIRTGMMTIGQEFRKDHGFGADGTYATVAVSDTGNGMDELTRARIFEPFFTTKELGRGTGLGLAIVYGAMKQNKGYVTVVSDPGKGACFTLYFPRIDTPVANEQPQRAIGTDQRGTGVILLAEDDAALRNLLRMMLKEFGYTVIEAVDGEDAVAKFTQHPGQADLLILDVIMPRKNGREAYEAIKQLQPAIRTLFISGYNDDVVNRNVLVDDGCRYLAKPITPANLLDTIKELLPPRVPG